MPRLAKCRPIVFAVVILALDGGGASLRVEGYNVVKKMVPLSQ